MYVLFWKITGNLIRGHGSVLIYNGLGSGSEHNDYQSSSKIASKAVLNVTYHFASLFQLRFKRPMPFMMTEEAITFTSYDKQIRLANNVQEIMECTDENNKSAKHNVNMESHD